MDFFPHVMIAMVLFAQISTTSEAICGCISLHDQLLSFGNKKMQPKKQPVIAEKAEKTGVLQHLQDSLNIFLWFGFCICTLQRSEMLGEWQKQGEKSSYILGYPQCDCGGREDDVTETGIHHRQSSSSSGCYHGCIEKLLQSPQRHWTIVCY